MARRPELPAYLQEGFILPYNRADAARFHVLAGIAAAAVAGRQILRQRQSSFPIVLPSVVPMVSSYLLFEPGPYRRPSCAQGLPNCCVDRGDVHGAGSDGGFQRRSPIGGFANGTPFHA